MPLFIAFEKHTAVVGGVQVTLLAGQTIDDATYPHSLPALTAAGFKFGPVVTGGPNTQFLRRDGAWAIPAGGGGGGLPPDGNYGDILVGAAGTSWQINPGVVGTTELADDAVTYAKLQNVSAADKLLGRATAGAGNVEEIDCTAAGRALLDDANAAAQRTTLGLGALATKSTVATADLDNNAVTFAKMQDINTGRLIGRATAGSGDPEELTLSGFDTSGGVISPANQRSMALYPVWWNLASAGSTTQVSTSGSLSCRAFYYGKAPKAITSLVVRYRVTTAGSGFAWAELAIGTAAPVNGGPTSVVIQGYTDTSGIWNSTGVKSTTIAVTGTVAAGDDIWLVWAKSSTGSPSFRAMSVGDDLATGLQAFSDGTQPSGLPGGYFAEAAGALGIWAVIFL